MTFQYWMQHQGLSSASVNKYETAVRGVLSEWAQAAGLLDGPLTALESHKRFLQVAEKIRELEIFLQRNSVGKGMYSAALNKFGEYLLSAFEQDIEDDLEHILVNEATAETDKITAVKTRIGQGVFRHKLIGYWQGCAVTRYPDTSLLVASHIKPWRDSSSEERLDKYNGLLLLPSFDKVFDKGLITFEENGKIKISELLEMPNLFGIANNMGVKLEKGHQDYLAFHREQVFCR